MEELNLENFTEPEKEIKAKNHNKKIKKPAGIAFRMLLLMIIFIFMIFTAIFLSFNFFIEDYIRRDMQNQLEIAVQDIKQNSASVIFYSQSITIGADFVPSLEIDPFRVYMSVTRYLRDKNANSEVNTIIYSQNDYERHFPNLDFDMLVNLDEMDNILNVIAVNNLNEDNKIYTVTSQFGNYYLTILDLGSLYGLKELRGLSTVFYVSSGKYDNLTQNIYGMLFVILLVATVFTILYVLFISRSISKPIQKLCSFADEIGHGNFTRNEYSFKDRELIDLNNRMNETAGKLEKIDDDQKTFFQNVSHELKTPLMSIKGYAEGIKYGVFAEEKEMNNATDIIMSEADRLNDLVADLLYISKIDASKKSENLDNANLVEIAESCAEKLRGLLIGQENGENKKINIIRPKKDIYINCDGESLMRAILNIAANCVQYAKTTVEISFHETEKNIYLYITDDGIGIAEEDLPNIFKRFYKGKTGKHGIGLSIAKSIIEQHGAEITALNRADATGAEFIIEFEKI